jgi:hypothetical protein
VRAAGATVRSAYVPVTEPAVYTRSPGLNAVTPSPTASTVPAPSEPGV